MKAFVLSSAYVLFMVLAVTPSYAFTTTTTNKVTTRKPMTSNAPFHPFIIPASVVTKHPLHILHQSNNDDDDDDDAWDSPEDYNEKPKPSSSSFSSSQPSLGINIGSQLEPLTEEQAAELKREATEKINEAFDERLADIESMKRDIRKDFEKSKENLRYASELRARDATSKLMSKIDKISNDFLEQNEELRMGTKLSAKADMENMRAGVGLEVGSWGTIDGVNVGMGMGLKSGGSGLLGSVGSGSITSDDSNTDDDQDGAMVEQNENRIMLICDDKQDKDVQKVLDKFQTILSDEFNSPVTIDTFKPTSNIPMGGNNAQCVILSSTSLSNGQSSANNILSRILRRTIAPSGGKVSKPPSHFVVLSPLGTERIEKFPYSMTNMMGGNKLKKAREVEEVIISTVKGRLIADSSVGNGPSLDYTILKLGDIVEDNKIGKKDGMINIAPGDNLDGKVGINAAANTLYQSLVLRPTARNATLSIIGGMDGTVSEGQWDDWFLRLDGPELWRKEGLLGDGGVVDLTSADRKFEELANYIKEWSTMFENGAKGTGLTTPVTVVPSRFDNQYDSSTIQAKFGVRLEFKTTNTGAAYKSKDEERELERQTSGSMNTSKQPVISTLKQKREGGVEIIVERTMDEDGKSDLRVRAKRCNMSDSTVVKELSEETIVKKLGKAVDVWIK